MVVPNEKASVRPRGLLLAAVVFTVAFAGPTTRGLALDESAEASDRGAQIYREQCAACHGDKGEGVKAAYPRVLTGDKSIAELARYITAEMPEDKPEACVGDDATAVARYIYDAFYSPIAQARIRPPRIELSRLTVRQYRNAVADVIGSFREDASFGDERGLRGEYYNARQPGRDRERVIDRLDPEVRFDFSENESVPEELGREGFAARWGGSLWAPETGVYELIVKTDHAARLWVNDLDEPIIDAWVKSGSDTEYKASIALLEGRPYSVRLEFSSRKQGVDDKKKPEKPIPAFIELWWKTPLRTAEPIPSRFLAPRSVPELFVLETPFPPDDRSQGYERGTSISKAWADATTAAAIETAGYVAKEIDNLARTRERDDNRDEKIRAFLVRFVERAFRRPLGEDERGIYIDRQLESAPDVETAIKRVVMLTLTSPRFLYLDFGSPDRKPDAFTIAARLSFAIWDSIPDAELLEKAREGKLGTREEIAREAARMVRDPRARSKTLAFLHHWLEIENISELGKDADRFPGFGPEIASDLRTSLELTLEETLWGESRDFRKLFASNEIYVNGRLARFYGYDLPADAPFQKVSAVRPERTGILAHPYLMARFAYTDVSSPIHRGVFLVRKILGRPLRPPPEAFTPIAPDLHPDLTTRERVALQTSPSPCNSCHERINPLGFTLEHFDAVGRFRDEERGKPIDASGGYELAPGQVISFASARDLGTFLADHSETHRAFALQFFHYAVKQPIFAYGTETPEELRAAFAAKGYDVSELLVEIATTAARVGLEADSEPQPRRGRRMRL